jgi:hypothetical protein
MLLKWASLNHETLYLTLRSHHTYISYIAGDKKFFSNSEIKY